MTNPNWKPQPGKPAMTRDEKTLVTDLEYPTGIDWPFWSKRLKHFWMVDGNSYLRWRDFDLIEPTAAILAAHGIDADGKPVAKGARFATGTIFQPEIFTQAGDFEASPSDAPAPSTRVDDRWFRLYERAFEGAMACGEYAPSEAEAMVAHALKAADLAFAEVSKREGR